MSAIQRRVLLSKDLLSIHQDPLGLPGGRVATWNCGDGDARRRAQEPTYPPSVQCPGDHNFCNLTEGQGGWGTCARPDEAGGPPNKRNTCFVPLCQIWYNPTLLTHYFSATFRPFCAVFSPLFRGFRLPGAKTERTGEIWGRNGRETAVAK